MIQKIAASILVSAILILAGCKQDGDNTKLSPALYDYIPVNKGHAIIYDVDSVRFNYISSQQVDTFHYQIKEVVLDTFNCQIGTLCYSMAEYKRTDTTQPFPSTYRAWYSFINHNTTYEIVDYDLHFVKFVFPPILGIHWQGNEYLPANDTVADTYQPYTGWTYTITSVNAPAIVNNQRFDSTTIVTEINTELTDKVYGALSRNTYARHIGLIYREWEILDKQDVQSSYDYPNQTNGFRIRMRIHSYTP